MNKPVTTISELTFLINKICLHIICVVMVHHDYSQPENDNGGAAKFKVVAAGHPCPSLFIAAKCHLPLSKPLSTSERRTLTKVRLENISTQHEASEVRSTTEYKWVSVDSACCRRKDKQPIWSKCTSTWRRRRRHGARP